MTDQRERMDAEQKEGSMRAAGTEFDTEFAADTWMGAVLNPGAASPRRSIAYDPDTYTERYLGEQPSQAVSADSPNADDGRETPAHATRPLDDGPERAAGEDADRLSRYEMAEEAAALPRPLNAGDRAETRAPKEREEDAAGSGMGMIALGLSILSLFFLPYLLAPTGMVLGYLAYRRNARRLGAWAMGIGVLAVLGAVLIYPFVVS